MNINNDIYYNPFLMTSETKGKIKISAIMDKIPKNPLWDSVKRAFTGTRTHRKVTELIMEYSITTSGICIVNLLDRDSGLTRFDIDNSWTYECDFRYTNAHTSNMDPVNVCIQSDVAQIIKNGSSLEVNRLCLYNPNKVKQSIYIERSNNRWRAYVETTDLRIAVPPDMCAAVLCTIIKALHSQ